MLLKPENSDTENGIKKNSKFSPEKKNHVQRELENWKRHFLKCKKIPAFHFKKRPASYKN